MFRPVPYDKMLEKFASDRSHMIKKTLKNGEKIYNSPIPNYPNIVN